MWLFYQWEPRGGLDPFTAVNTGISNKLGIGLGVYQLAVNLVISIYCRELGDFHFYFVAGP